MSSFFRASVRRASVVQAVFLVLLSASQLAQAQVRCTMPSGVKITQQLGNCPRGAVAAERMDGTALTLEQAPPQGVAIKGVIATGPSTTTAPNGLAADDSEGMSLGAWLLVGLLGFGLFAGIKGSAGISGPVRYCATCGHQGKGKTRTRGSLMVEIVLWLCFLIPGLIYSIWRQSSKHKVCASCGSSTLVPLSSPVAVAARRVESEPVGTSSHAEPQSAAVDAWEGAFYDVSEQRSADKSVRISYRAGDGEVTERVVDVRAFEPRGAGGLVIGRCQLRNATRTFRFDRMTRVVDEDTGEIIPDLQSCLNAEWEASPEPVLDALFRQHRELLKMLLYAAKADGAVRIAELQVIARHCAQLTGDERITPSLVKDLLAMLDVPSVASFTRSYNKLRRENPNDAERAAQACREIVATQKTIHPTEQAMLDALDKPLPTASSTNRQTPISA